MTNRGIGIIESSHYLPEGIQSNEQLCEILKTVNPEWIIAKTGIKRRYHVGDKDTAGSMATKCAANLIEKAGIEKDKIGLIVLASFSQDYLFPPLSAKIHVNLGLSKNCQIMDVNTNCTGFVTALSIASERMKFDPSIQYAMVIGVEVLSKFTNMADQDTAIFFSDGAAAMLLGHVETEKGYMNAKFLTDSSTYESVRMRGGGSSFPINEKNKDEKSFYLEQNGLATWKQAITNLPVVINNLLNSEKLTIEQIDFVIFHQANGFLINYIMKKMKIAPEKTYMNVEEIGNTGSASIGIAISEAFDKGLIKSGDNLLIAGVGAGFNFGACLFKI